MEPAYKNIQSVFSNTLFLREKIIITPIKYLFLLKKIFRKWRRSHWALVQDIRWAHFLAVIPVAQQALSILRTVLDIRSYVAIEASKGKEKVIMEYFL